MIAVVLAALSGMSYGASDFSGAVATKDNDATVITTAVQVVSLVSLVVALALTRPEPNAADLAWGALAGLGAAVALTSFYKALAIGPMSVAASLTALISAAVPVIAGFVLGDRPNGLTLIGIALAVPAAVLVSMAGVGPRGAPVILPPRERFVVRSGANRTRGLAVIAGLGFSVFFIALSRTSGDSELFPLLGARIASISALGSVLTVTGTWRAVARPSWLTVAIAGVLDFAANSFYILALDRGSLAWVAAISSLYPVSTVILARMFLGERLAPIQVFGLVMAGGALALVAVGAT